MRFNNHSNLAGRHAFLSASKYHWINYDEEKMDDVYGKALAAMRGSQLHDFAMQAIKLGIKQSRTTKTLNMYINDAIGFRMTPEVLLYYSDNAFGTADTISFRNNLLRIHDLKTGTTKTSFKQLEVYTAFFCLEYDFKPTEIEIELRIYQNDEINIHIPDPVEIVRIMDRIVTFDALIENKKAEELG